MASGYHRFFWKAYLPIENTLNGKRPRLVHRPRAGPTQAITVTAADPPGFTPQAHCQSRWQMILQSPPARRVRHLLPLGLFLHDRPFRAARSRFGALISLEVRSPGHGRRKPLFSFSKENKLRLCNGTASVWDPAAHACGTLHIATPSPSFPSVAVAARLAFFARAHPGLLIARQAFAAHVTGLAVVAPRQTP